MKQNKKALISFASLLILCSFGFTSCQKSGSFDSYYYLSQQVGSGDPATNTVTIDGTNYGIIQYVAAPVTEQSSGLNHVKLPFGRHNITVYDANHKAIISGYINNTGNEVGSGSWGPAAGGEDVNGNTSDNSLLVGLFE
jgi:hypothetical protein